MWLSCFCSSVCPQRASWSQSWRDISWSGTVLVCAGVAIGALVGTYFLAASAPVFVLRLVAVLLVLSGFDFLCSWGRTYVVRWPRWTELPVGWACCRGCSGRVGRRSSFTIVSRA